MTAPARLLPDSSDDAAWRDPATVAAIAGVTVQTWDCCGQLVGEVHDCNDNWVRDEYPVPPHFFGDVR